MHEITILSLPQHRIKFYFRFFKWVLVAILGLGISFIFSEYQTLILIISVIILAVGFWAENDRYKKSVLVITDGRVLLRVKKGLFSAFEVGLHFEQIINCTYVKQNFLHSLTNSGTLFFRASEKQEGQIIAEFVPKVEEIVALINRLLILSPQKRREYAEARQSEIATTGTSDQAKFMHAEEKSTLSDEEIIATETKKLLATPGILGVHVLSPSEKKMIFMKEEDRNHGVFETLRRKFTFCVLHGDGFRLPDAPIVHAAGGRVIFPPVPFHEIGRENAISGSPSSLVHQELLNYFGDTKEGDATVLIGFD